MSDGWWGLLLILGLTLAYALAVGLWSAHYRASFGLAPRRFLLGPVRRDRPTD